MSVLTEEVVLIAGPAGNIETMWQPSSEKDAPFAVICHPHPLYGGSLNNKVVTTLARVWRDLGHSVLRFNFRGVGKSEGQHDGGLGEIEDLLAVVAWAQRQQMSTTWDLAGFSFGAWVAAAATDRFAEAQRPRHLVLAAPPVQYDGFAALHPSVPTQVLLGEDDDVVDPEAVKQWVASRSTPPDLQCFPAAGHFFHGQLPALRQAVQTWLA